MAGTDRSRVRVAAACVALAGAALLGCAAETGDSARGGATGGRTLPLGDGRVSSASEAGSVFSCRQDFAGAGVGALRDGPWIGSDT